MLTMSQGLSHLSLPFLGAPVQEIAEIKLPDLNCTSIEPAMKIVEGTAKNMGITITE